MLNNKQQVSFIANQTVLYEWMPARRDRNRIIQEEIVAPSRFQCIWS